MDSGIVKSGWKGDVSYIAIIMQEYDDYTAIIKPADLDSEAYFTQLHNNRDEAYAGMKARWNELMNRNAWKNGEAKNICERYENMDKLPCSF